MSNFDSDGSSENQWDDRGELAWNEFDWERYLRQQEEAILRYRQLYREAGNSSDRIDVVAEKMNWDGDAWNDRATDSDEDDSLVDSPEDDVYTLHKNPIYIATRAIYQELHAAWEPLTRDEAATPRTLAVSFLASLHRGEEQSLQAIYALDFGDYALAVSLFKRALGVLNGSLALAGNADAGDHPSLAIWRTQAMPSLFDLREIWLRVISECRSELDRPVDEEN